MTTPMWFGGFCGHLAMPLVYQDDLAGGILIGYSIAWILSSLFRGTSQ